MIVGMDPEDLLRDIRVGKVIRQWIGSLMSQGITPWVVETAASTTDAVWNVDEALTVIRGPRNDPRSRIRSKTSSGLVISWLGKIHHASHYADPNTGDRGRNGLL